MKNFLLYESTMRVRRLTDAIRFRLLRAVLDQRRHVPRFLQGMPVETVLSFARRRL